MASWGLWEGDLSVAYPRYIRTRVYKVYRWTAKNYSERISLLEYPRHIRIQRIPLCTGGQQKIMARRSQCWDYSRFIGFQGITKITGRQLGNMTRRSHFFPRYIKIQRITKFICGQFWSMVKRSHCILDA